jgi:hypothetical protein
MQKRYPGCATMLIPRPREIDMLIRTIRNGNLIKQAEIRRHLAGKHMADTTCPLATGSACASQPKPPKSRPATVNRRLRRTGAR